MKYDLYDSGKKVGEANWKISIFIWLLRTAFPDALAGKRVELKAVNRKTGEEVESLWLAPMGKKL